MASEPNEEWASVELDETFVPRRAGGSAAEKAAARHATEPFRTVLARFFGIQAEEPAWRRGADGERLAGWWLGRLPAGWHVFHDLPAGEGEQIDHLVIGPAGVFTISTKDLTGKVWVGAKSILHNRRRTDFLPRASAEARRASQLLSGAVGRPVEVRGALAILADDWTIKQRPAEVYVGATRSVKDWMLRQPVVLRAAEVTVLAVAASKPDTWITPPLFEAENIAG